MVRSLSELTFQVAISSAEPPIEAEKQTKEEKNKESVNELSQGITAQVVAQFINRSVVELANTYFGHIADYNQKITAASNAVRAAGYAVGRGQLIYLPRQKLPDVQMKVAKDGSQYVQVKGKFDPNNPRAQAGISAMIFPSKYGPVFSISMISFGGRVAPQQGIRLTAKKEDIIAEPDGGLVIKLKFYPDRTQMPTLMGWLAATQLPPVGTIPASAAPAPEESCFGMYDASAPECAGCAAASECSAVPRV